MLTYSSRSIPRGIQIAAIALILLLPAADGLLAQPVSDNLRLGSTVRVVTPDPDAPVIEGAVRTIDAARLTLASREYGLRDLPWAEVDSLFVRHYTSKAGRGAGYGLLAGATISGLVMFATYEECEEETPFSCLMYPSREFVTLAGAITGGLLGAVAGFFAGASKSSTRWERVDLDVGIRPVTSDAQSGKRSIAPSFRLTIPLGR